MIRFALATIPMPFSFRWIRLYPYLRLLFPERLAHELRQRRVLVRTFHGLELVMVRAARDADHGQQASGGHAELLTGLFDEDGLLSAGQVFRDCARLFSQQLDHALPDRDLDVQFPLLPPLPLDVGVQLVQTGTRLRQPLLQRRHRVRQAGRVPRTAGVEGSTPVFPSPAVVGFSPGVFVTCVSLDPSSICRFQFPDDGRLHAQLGGRLT